MLHIVRIASLRICFWFKGQDLTFDNLKLKYLSLWGLKLGSNLSDKFVANLFFKMEGSKTKNKATKQFEAPGHLKSYVFMSKLELYEWRGDTKNGIKNPWAIISNEPCDSQLAEPIQNFNHENGVWEYHFIIIMSSTILLKSHLVVSEQSEHKKHQSFEKQWSGKIQNLSGTKMWTLKPHLLALWH